MLTNFEVRQIVIDHAKTFANLNVVPVEYENQFGFKPPSKSLWSRLTIQYSSAIQSGLHNGRLERDFGIINIQCFARKGTGDYELVQLAEKWRNHFKSLVVGNFEVTLTHPPTTTQHELDSDFIMSLVRVDFRVN